MSFVIFFVGLSKCRNGCLIKKVYNWCEFRKEQSIFLVLPKLHYTGKFVKTAKLKCFTFMLYTRIIVSFNHISIGKFVLWLLMREEKSTQRGLYIQVNYTFMHLDKISDGDLIVCSSSGLCFTSVQDVFKLKFRFELTHKSAGMR